MVLEICAASYVVRVSWHFERQALFQPQVEFCFLLTVYLYFLGLVVLFVSYVGILGFGVLTGFLLCAWIGVRPVTHCE